MEIIRRRRTGAIRFETAHWPLLIVRFARHVTDDDFADYLDGMSAMLSRRERHALVLDASVGALPPVHRVRGQARWLREHRDAIAELCAGTVFVFRSRLFRHVMNAVFMLQPLPARFHVAHTIDEAAAWAAERLGIEPPTSGLVWSDEETTSPNARPQPARPPQDGS